MLWTLGGLAVFFYLAMLWFAWRAYRVDRLPWLLAALVCAGLMSLSALGAHLLLVQQGAYPEQQGAEEQGAH